MKYRQYFIFYLLLLLFPFLVLCEDKIPLFELAKEQLGGVKQGNFFYAFHYCRSIGKNVPTPNTKEKNDALTKYLRKNNIAITWTSGDDLSEEGKFLWMLDGSKVTYSKWHGDNPDNFLQNEHCIEVLLKSDGHYYWNDAPCSNKHPIVCEGEDLKSQLPQAIKCIDVI